MAIMKSINYVSAFVDVRLLSSRYLLRQKMTRNHCTFKLTELLADHVRGQTTNKRNEMTSIPAANAAILKHLAASFFSSRQVAGDHTEYVFHRQSLLRNVVEDASNA